MDTAAELESGADDRREGPASSVTAASPVQQLSLWPPPRSTRHSGRRRRQFTVLGAVALAVLLVGGGATAWALLADGEEAPQEAAAPAEEFVGAWAGEMVQVNTEGQHVADWHAEVRIEEGAERGSTAWTTFTCSGTLVLSAGDNDRRVYAYTETADPEDRCVDEAELTLSPVADGGLRAEWSSITDEGTRMTSTGPLS
ncbi:hypothetical protein [Nocardiopsis synnemataformans]|uniref:hypothetical protein n=1 Tax=Nocardiopsis synnemataformans TaxID=61305 RepID=UPI003EBE6346